MAGQNERIGTCETCSKPIREQDHYHYTSDSCWLCEDHAPMLSDIVKQYRDMIESGEKYCDADDLEHAKEYLPILEREIETKGDRRALHN